MKATERPACRNTQQQRWETRGEAMLTPRQAAERMGVSLSLVYSWVESRQLAHYRAGANGRRGKILIGEADLAAFMEGLKVPPAPEQKRQTPPAPKPRLKLKHVSI